VIGKSTGNVQNHSKENKTVMSLLKKKTKQNHFTSQTSPPSSRKVVHPEFRVCLFLTGWKEWDVGE